MNVARRIVLASASPRRRQLLASAGIDTTVIPADVDESIDVNPSDPGAAATQLAVEKATSVARDRPNDVVVGADTMVILDGVELGKPANADEAWEMLTKLRERSHQVITGVAVVRADRSAVAHATTYVQMRPYSDAEISAHVERGEPFDKAGSYAIQDPEFQPVAGWEGCYCNVVGLPLIMTLNMLAEFDSTLATDSTTLPIQCANCPFRRLAGPPN